MYAPVRGRLYPGYVVAHRGYFPPLHRGWRDEHGEVGLATGAWESGGYVSLLSLGVLYTQDQHVLGKPALVAGKDRRDAQGEGFLAEQGVAAIARAERPDRALLREVDNVLLLAVAGPRHVLLARGEGHAHGVHAGHEFAIIQYVQHRAAHAGHDAHARGDVWRVG